MSFGQKHLFDQSFHLNFYCELILAFIWLFSWLLLIFCEIYLLWELPLGFSIFKWHGFEIVQKMMVNTVDWHVYVIFVCVEYFFLLFSEVFIDFFFKLSEIFFGHLDGFQFGFLDFLDFLFEVLFEFRCLLGWIEKRIGIFAWGLGD